MKAGSTGLFELFVPYESENLNLGIGWEELIQPN